MGRRIHGPVEIWYLALEEQQQDRVDFVVGLLER